jgi:hypothetical protein
LLANVAVECQSDYDQGGAVVLLEEHGSMRLRMPKGCSCCLSLSKVQVILIAQAFVTCDSYWVPLDIMAFSRLPLQLSTTV